MKRIDRARKHHLRVAHQPKHHKWYSQLKVLANLYNNTQPQSSLVQH